MAPNLLILGGTTEATALAQAVADAGIQATFSFAGRVARPKPIPIPRRVGGFGGVPGLITYLREHQITHVIDATHPFAAQMSRNAIAACAEAKIPLTALTRAPWTPQPGDNWTRVPDIAGAVAALSGDPKRVMLALGRLNLPAFEAVPQHFYLLRLVDPPEAPPAFPDHHIVLDRGPFTEAGDLALIQEHRIELVISKNSGGTAAYAKIIASRRLGLPVIMIDRPQVPDRHEVYSVQDALTWLGHAVTARGV